MPFSSLGNVQNIGTALRSTLVPTPLDPYDVVPDLYEDLVVRQSQALYNHGKFVGFGFDLGVRRSPTGPVEPVAKFVKLMRVVRIPPIGIQRTNESVALVDMHRDVLAGLRQTGIMPVTVIANDPYRHGLLYLVGVQAVAPTRAGAKELAEQSLEATRDVLRSYYRQIGLREINEDEARWLTDRLVAWDQIAVFRGLPRPRREASAALVLPLGGVSSESVLEEQIEAFCRGMTNREYMLFFLASPLSEAAILRIWRKISKHLERVESDVEKSRTYAAGVALPMGFLGNFGGTQGLNHSDSVGAGTSNSHSVTDSVGTSNTTTHGTSQSITQGESVTHGVNEGANFSQSHSTGTNQSLSQTAGTSIAHSNTSTTGTSTSESLSESTSASVAHSQSSTNSYQVNQGQSTTTGTTEGTSQGFSANFGTNDSTTKGTFGSISNGTSTNHSTTESNSFGGSVGGEILGVSGTHSSGTTDGTGTSHGDTTGGSTNHTSGSSESIGASSGSSYSTSASSTNSSGQSWGTSNSVGTTDTFGVTRGATVGSGTSQSQSVGTTTGSSQSTSLSSGTSTGESSSSGTSVGTSDTTGASSSTSAGVSDSTSVGTTTGRAVGDTTGTSTSTGQSAGDSLGSSWGWGGSMGIAPSLSVSYNKKFFQEHLRNLANILATQRSRFTLARQEGAWQTYAYLLAPDAATKESAVTVATSSFWGPAEKGDLPTKFHALVDLEADEQRHLLEHVRTLSGCRVKEPSDMTPESYAYSTVHTTSELAVLIHPPRIDLPGLQCMFEPIPPFRIPVDADGPLRLGKLVNGETGEPSEFHFGLEPRHPSHIMVCGATRVGKSVSTEQIVVNWVNQPPKKVFEIGPDGIRREKQRPYGCIILDWKKTWRGIYNHVDPSRFHFVSMWDPSLGWKFNLLRVPKGVPPALHMDRFAETLALAFSLGLRGKGIIREALQTLYDRQMPLSWLRSGAPPGESACVMTEPEMSRFIGMADLYQQTEIMLNEAMANSRSVGPSRRDGIETVRMRLQYFAPGEHLAQIFTRDTTAAELAADPQIERRFRNGEFSLEGCVRLEDLISDQRVVVMEGGPLDPVAKKALVTTLATSIFTAAQCRGDNAFDPELMVVLEEAHEVLVGGETSDAQIAGQAETIWEIMWNEGASYGLRLVAICQMPDALPMSVLANSGTVICHRIETSKAQEALMVKLGKDYRIDHRPLKRFLGNLPVGWCVVRRPPSRDYGEADVVLVATDMLSHVVPDDEMLRRHTRFVEPIGTIAA
jgi:hypothetical protein